MNLSDMEREVYQILREEPTIRQIDFSKSFGFDRAVYPEAYKKIERAWLD